jgi:hypothetical protein
LPQFMVLGLELPMFVERIILSTPFQPGEHHICLACWARELLVNTPRAELAIRQEVMQRILVPHMHCEVPLRSSVVRQHPLVPSMLQFNPHWLHEHTYIFAWVSRYLLTPKIGTGERLICGPNLVTNPVQRGEDFFRRFGRDACGRQFASVRQRDCLR